MAINTDIYGTQQEADEYFAARLHESAWTSATAADRRKALIAARAIIDGLNYKGVKHSVYTVCGPNPETSGASQDDIRAAEASQPLEFPRGADTEVPEAITGEQVMMTRSPDEAVKRMKEMPEQWGNLFRSNVVSGIGSSSATGGLMPGYGGKIDVRKLTQAQYLEIRAKNPELLGLAPKRR